MPIFIETGQSFQKGGSIVSTYDQRSFVAADTLIAYTLFIGNFRYVIKVEKIKQKVENS